MPLQRPSLPWYQDNLLTLRGALESGVLALKLDNVTKIDCISVLTQEFVGDQVHLTETSGVSFINFILSQSETFFKSANIDLTNYDDDLSPNNDDDLKKRIEQIEAAFRTRNISDNLVIACLREELDSTANRTGEDRIIINGLVCKKPLPQEFFEKSLPPSVSF